MAPSPEVKMKTPNHITHNNPALSDGHCRPLHLIWASISSAAEWAGRPQTQDGVASIPTRQSHSAPSVPTGDKSSAHVPLSHVKPAFGEYREERRNDSLDLHPWPQAQEKSHS